MVNSYSVLGAINNRTNEDSQHKKLHASSTNQTNKKPDNKHNKTKNVLGAPVNNEKPVKNVIQNTNLNALLGLVK